MKNVSEWMSVLDNKNKKLEHVKSKESNQIIPLFAYIMAEVGLSIIASVKFSIASSNLPAFQSHVRSNHNSIVINLWMLERIWIAKKAQNSLEIFEIGQSMGQSMGTVRTLGYSKK